MIRAVLAVPLSLCVLLTGCIIERQQPPPPPPPPPPAAAAAAPKAAPAPASRPTVAQPAADGRPATLSDKEDGIWIWRTNNGQWHLRTTSPGKKRHFAGNIAGKGAEVKAANSVRPEAGDKIALNGGKIDFEVNTNGNNDACVIFDLTIDAEQVPQKIIVGHQEAHPQSAHFNSCP
jgi:hypothetical protein